MKLPPVSKTPRRKPVKATLTAGTAPTDAAAAVFSPSSEEVAYRAFLNYQNHGAADGQDVKDWLVAEAELIAEHQVGVTV